MRALTLAEAAEALDPPMPRRELARRLKHVAPLGSVYGRRGRRAATYPTTEIMRAHAAWVRDRDLAMIPLRARIRPSSPCADSETS